MMRLFVRLSSCGAMEWYGGRPIRPSRRRRPFLNARLLESLQSLQCNLNNIYQAKLNYMNDACVACGMQL